MQIHERTDIQTDTRADRDTGIYTSGQTDRQIHEKRHRHIHERTDRPTLIVMPCSGLSSLYTDM